MSLDLPPNAGPDREAAIFEAVQSGRADVVWKPIKSQYKNWEGIFYVFSDALKIDGIRVNITAKTQQKIADFWGYSLLTAKLADLIFAQADVIVKPFPRKITATTKAMIEHSSDIEKAVAGRTGLISTVGKHWILDVALARPRMANQAINYGWHFKGGLPGIKGEIPAARDVVPGVRVIQGRGMHHNYIHSDYSQTCILVARECEINGTVMDLHEVLNHPDMAFLASHSGPLPILRQPGVKDPGTIFVVPEKIGL